MLTVCVQFELLKVLEMYVLEENNSHEYFELQFRFIPGRGTEIATALFNDLTKYCNARGSAV